jgi:hypothetical protein
MLIGDFALTKKKFQDGNIFGIDDNAKEFSRTYTLLLRLKRI